MSLPGSNPRFISHPKTVAIVGCLFGLGQDRPGVEQGPVSLVNAGLEEDIKALGWNVAFDGHHHFEEITIKEDPMADNLKNPKNVSRVCEAVARIVGDHARQRQLPLTLGGDHSLALGTISGTLREYPEAHVIWVDAHADINTNQTSTTGRMHGMPLSFLLGIHPQVEAFNWVQPLLQPDRLVYIGLRSVDSGERQFLRDHGIVAFSMHDIDHEGIITVMRTALNYVQRKGPVPIHLSFDIDALDPTVAPATGTPVHGGLSSREGRYICEAIHETGCLVAMDIVEVNPKLGVNDRDVEQTVEVACLIAHAALGKTLV